jgi:CBS domain-containing protein
MGNLVSDIMTAPPVTITADLEVDEIATIMASKNIHTLPVLEGDKLIGIIGKIDIIRALGQEG